jgi:hypothetical protein
VPSSIGTSGPIGASRIVCALVAAPSSVGAQGDSLSIARIWDSEEFQARGVTQIRKSALAMGACVFDPAAAGAGLAV